MVDRLAADLREAFPEIKGFSPRNLKYMRAFAAAWPEREFVQEPLARILWYHHIALLEKKTPLNAFGTLAGRWSEVGRITSSCCKFRAEHTNAKAKR